VLGSTLDLLCWFGALGAIGAYVAALLRNRPHLRPLNSLGLLLVGGALLGLPTVIGHPMPPGREPFVIYVAVLLVASVVFQTVSAFRRRRDRAAPTATPAAGAR
jgi:hypothetical protein